MEYPGRLSENSALAEGYVTGPDLKSVIVDFDLILTLRELAVLLPGNFHGENLALDIVNRFLYGEDLVTGVAGGKGSRTQGLYRDRLTGGVGDADVKVLGAGF